MNNNFFIYFLCNEIINTILKLNLEPIILKFWIILNTKKYRHLIGI